MNTLIKKMFVIGSCCAYLMLATPTYIFAQNDHHLVPECPAMIAAVIPTTTVSNTSTFDAQVPQKGLDDQFSQKKVFKQHGNLASFNNLLSPTLQAVLKSTTTISQIDNLLAKTMQLDIYANATTKNAPPLVKRPNKYKLQPLNTTTKYPHIVGTSYPIAQTQLLEALQEAVRQANKKKGREHITTTGNPSAFATQSIASLDQVLMQSGHVATVREEAKTPIGVIANSVTLIKKKPDFTNKCPHIAYSYAVTPAQVAQIYDLAVKDVMSYNDLTHAAAIIPSNTPIYLAAKKTKGMVKLHTVRTKESMWLIAQTHGIRLDKLYERNQMQVGQEPMEGEQIWLRGKVNAPPKIARQKQDNKPIKAKVMDNLKYKYDRKDPGRMFNG